MTRLRATNHSRERWDRTFSLTPLQEPEREPSRFAAHGSLPKLRTCRNRLRLPARCGRGPFAVRRRGFMVPMHAEKRKGALHEPQSRAGCPQPAGLRRGEDTAPYQTARFMATMHVRILEVFPFHESTLVPSPAFRRHEQLGPAKAGTPNPQPFTVAYNSYA